MLTPGVSIGTRIIDCCLCFGALGSDLPIKMAMRQRGSPAPDVHHLRPLIKYSSPLRTMLERMFVASEEGTSGSFMAKQERISPASSGLSHFSFCSAVPYRARTSMLPVSGAEQLKTSGAMCERPIISQSGAYSRLDRPAPRSLSGRKRFQRPAFSAFG